MTRSSLGATKVFQAHSFPGHMHGRCSLIRGSTLWVCISSPAARFASWAFPQAHSPIFMWIWKRFGEGLHRICARLENTLEEHRAVRAALDIFGRDTGEAKIRDLAAHLGLSQRHFIKVFSNQVGVTPKLFGRVQRFQRAVNLTRNSSTPDWADIAAACGYFDQSHLIHDFQTFSGLSPTEFQRQRNERLLTSPPITE
jgi:AraC-like DNA-binding protein